MVDYTKYIEADPAILLGKPRIKGTRLSVELVLRKLSEGASVEELCAQYPGIGEQDIQAVLSFAADVVAGEEHFDSAA